MRFCMSMTLLLALKKYCALVRATVYYVGCLTGVINDDDDDDDDDKATLAEGSCGQ